MKLHRIIALLAAALTLSAVWAATAHDEVSSNYRRSASNHHAYPIGTEVPVPALTAAPAGYEAFYIDHYGRHGSRWLTRQATYERPVNQLMRAQREGRLNPVGERLLRTLQRINLAATQRAGDLTDVGPEQHQAIAQRMAQNFPSVFTDDAIIDARSTVILRCILSMQNETMMLRTANPRMRITTDASYHDMYYMGWGYGEDTLANDLRKTVDYIPDSMYRANIDPSRFLASIMSDTLGVSHSINALQLMRDVFDLGGDLQSHHEFDDLNLFYLFTDDEIFNLWRIRNVYWYVHWANAPANGNRMPFIERALLRDMVEKADEAIASGQRGASLRFGHETCVLPLACLMEIDNVNYSTTDLDNLHLYWQDYNIIPMACNIQMVFYRPLGGDANADNVLVKVLYNEHEATLPVATDNAPYYRWSDVRRAFMAKIDTPISWAVE